MRRLLLLTAMLLLAFQAAAVASPSTRAATSSCKAQLKATGQPNFAQLYKSFGVCVSKATHLTNAQRQVLLSAERQCRAEQSANPTAFDSKYGTHHNKQDSFGKCVSQQASA
jgi:hypothetical protein